MTHNSQLCCVWQRFLLGLLSTACPFHCVNSAYDTAPRRVLGAVYEQRCAITLKTRLALLFHDFPLFQENSEDPVALRAKPRKEAVAGTPLIDAGKYPDLKPPTPFPRLFVSLRFAHGVGHL